MVLVTVICGLLRVSLILVAHISGETRLMYRCSGQLFIASVEFGAEIVQPLFDS